MAAQKFLSIINGARHLITAITTSAGAADDGKIPALGADGRLSLTMMPVGMGPDTATILASEAIAAGSYVDIYNNAGTANMRKADASTSGKAADGFVLASVNSGATGLVYFEGQNTQLSGLVAGTRYYLSDTTPGGVTATAPSTATHVVQFLGIALNATTLSTEIDDDITIE